MGFLAKLIGGTLQVTVGTAIGVVKDTVTMGGALIDEDPETIKQLKNGTKNITESLEDLSDGEIL